MRRLVLALAVLMAGCPEPAPVVKPPPPPLPLPPKVEPPPAAPQPVVKNNRIELPGPVLFDDDRDVLKPESDAVLEIVYQYLAQNKQVTKHRIEGHTSSEGDAAHNLKLSEDRAMMVAHWLVGKGIDCHRLIPVGFGSTRPRVTPEKTEEDRETNRRVDFINAEIDGKAIGGLPIDGGAERHGDPCK